jgi:hypothetical protein
MRHTRRITIFWGVIVMSIVLGPANDKGLLQAQEPLAIKIRPFREKNIDYTKEYKYQLLELILGKTKATDGPFRIDVLKAEMIAQSRVLDLIDRGTITVIATMTSKEREKKLRPIRIPIFKNLFGYRIFIINRRDQEKFARIQTEEQLQKLWAGLGHDWPDLKILKANGFNVVGSSSYRGLFSMLQEGRFDYFPRAVQEPWREVEEEKTRDLIVEPTLLIHYHAPVYFFVSNRNLKLYERIERGFQMAIQDGSFEKLFNTHWYIQDTLKLAKIRQRRIFRLNNPLLPPETPLDRKAFWYVPESSSAQ